MSKINHRRKNPVARVLNVINKPQTHVDRTKYRRHPKFKMRDF